MNMQTVRTPPAPSRAVAPPPRAGTGCAEPPPPAQAGDGPLAATLGWLALEEIDYGIVALGRAGEVLHANRRARTELESGDHPLQLAGGRVTARCGRDAARLAEGLHAACRGLRRLLEMERGDERVSVALVPLPANDRPAAALMLMGRRRLCENLSVQSFARANGLTLAETRVLEALCAGETAGAMARRQGVALSTVRTHLASIRTKTGTRSLQALVRRVAALPPLVSALRLSS